MAPALVARAGRVPGCACRVPWLVLLEVPSSHRLRDRVRDGDFSRDGGSDLSSSLDNPLTPAVASHLLVFSPPRLLFSMLQLCASSGTPHLRRDKPSTGDLTSFEGLTTDDKPHLRRAASPPPRYLIFSSSPLLVFAFLCFTPTRAGTSDKSTHHRRDNSHSTRDLSTPHPRRDTSRLASSPASRRMRHTPLRRVTSPPTRHPPSHLQHS